MPKLRVMCHVETTKNGVRQLQQELSEVTLNNVVRQVNLTTTPLPGENELALISIVSVAPPNCNLETYKKILQHRYSSRISRWLMGCQIFNLGEISVRDA